MKLGDCIFSSLNTKDFGALTFAGLVVKITTAHYHTRSIKNVEDKRIYRYNKLRLLTVAKTMTTHWAMAYAFNCHVGNESMICDFFGKEIKELFDEGHYK